MKIIRLLLDNVPRLGVVLDDGVVPIPATIAGDDVSAAIAGWDELAPKIESFVKTSSERIALADAKLLAPVGRPGKVLAIGLNYADHIAESGMATPEQQLWFAKLGNTVHPPFEPIQIPKVSDKIDYEVELVAVIGKAGRHISAEQAADHVFGYCVGNDVSVRDWQQMSPQWILGKSFDTHAPFGPWITTSDAIADPHALAIKCFVNGELRQSSNTKHLVFNLWDQIAHLSKAMTLEPGDLIFTGTPGGVGWAMDPKRVLKAGDVVRCEIESLGAIEAGFVDEPA